jgi:hypothetical protein
MMKSGYAVRAGQANARENNVMAGLDPAVLVSTAPREMAGSSPAMTRIRSYIRTLYFA